MGILVPLVPVVAVALLQRGRKAVAALPFGAVVGVWEGHMLGRVTGGAAVAAPVAAAAAAAVGAGHC